MYLPELPTIFVKDGVERKAFYTVEARDLKASGWVEKSEIKSAPKPASKPAAKATESPKVTEENAKTEKVKAATATESSK